MMLGHYHGERNMEVGTEGGRPQGAALVHARCAVNVNKGAVVLEVLNRCCFAIFDLED